MVTIVADDKDCENINVAETMITKIVLRWMKTTIGLIVIIIILNGDPYFNLLDSLSRRWNGVL